MRGGVTSHVASRVSAFFPNLTTTRPENPGPPLQLSAPDGPRAALLVAVVARIMGAVHRAGVGHRDVYPSNLLHRVADGGVIQVKVIDWDPGYMLEEGVPTEWLRRWAGKSKMKGRYRVTQDPKDLDPFMCRVVLWASGQATGAAARARWRRAAVSSSARESNGNCAAVQALYVDSYIPAELGGRPELPTPLAG